MIGVFRQRWAEPPVAADCAGEPRPWLALEEVRDPGNLGTIVRTVDAVGAKGMMLVGACCDPFSREAMRATMGSIFAVPLVRLGSRGTSSPGRKTWPGDIVGTHLDGAGGFPHRRY